MQVILFRFGKVYIPAVGWGGNAFTVISGEQGNKLDLRSREVCPGVFADETGGLFMVGSLLRGGRPANIMKQRGGDEQFEFGFGQAVDGGKFTKKKSRPEGDVADVLGFLFDLSHPSGGFSDER